MKQVFHAGQSLRKAEARATGYGSGRARILVTAERLFGERGIDAVSLRQIAVSAGQANNSAVAQHFGTKGGLITAIIETRRPIIDAIRRTRLARIYAREADPSLRDLVECLVMPWVDDVDEDGNHPYACFIAQLMWTERNFYPFDNLETSAPATHELLQLIRTRIPHLDDREVTLRTRLLVQMFLTTVLRKGQIGIAPVDELRGEAIFEKLIELATIMLSGPR